MISDAKLDNFQLFCQKAEAYGVCDKITGDDKHKRIHMGLDEYSRVRYYGCLRKDSMKIFYRSTEKVNINISGGSVLNVPTNESGFDYYSEIKQADYDTFLEFVSLKLGRNHSALTQGINIPMKPKQIITNPDRTVSYQCARCYEIFYRNRRCPECGQLVKEE